MPHLALSGGTPVRTEPFPSWPVYGNAEEEALLRVLHSGRWGRSDRGEVEQFEAEFAAFVGARHAIAVTSGTTALRIALLASGIREGDEVVVPPYTFQATATSVLEANATPVFADIQPDTYNLDPAAFEAAVTPRTRAVIPVHLAGLAADMDEIIAIAERHGILVIEDAAHAHGGTYRGRGLGSIGHMACFSFQSSKNMSAGEGGIITTSDPDLAETCSSIHNCGRIRGGAWYEHAILGGNFRMTEFQAALLRAQLARLPEQLEVRERNARRLIPRLEAVPGIRCQASARNDGRHAYHLFPYRYDPAVFGVSRAVFARAMRAEGIPIAEGYTVPLYRQPLFTRKAFGPYTGCLGSRPDLDYEAALCPVCDRICGEEGGWLYQSILLGSENDMDDIARAAAKIHEARDELRAASDGAAVVAGGVRQP